jgi:hypothetical protein
MIIGDNTKGIRCPTCKLAISRPLGPHCCTLILRCFLGCSLAPHHSYAHSVLNLRCITLVLALEVCMCTLPTFLGLKPHRTSTMLLFQHSVVPILALRCFFRCSSECLSWHPLFGLHLYDLLSFLLVF